MMHPAVDTPNYHLWTDALHARCLAHQAKNPWDQGTYIRWTIITAITVLEMVCAEELNVKNKKNSFKENLDSALEDNQFSKLDWGCGIWQEVKTLQTKRNKFVHRTTSLKELSPQLQESDEAIRIVRKAVHALYKHMSRNLPKWIDVDAVSGWDSGRDEFAHETVTMSGANRDDPDVIKIAYVYKGTEYPLTYCPPDADFEKLMYEFVSEKKYPISRVRTYRGSTVIYEMLFVMR